MAHDEHSGHWRRIAIVVVVLAVIIVIAASDATHSAIRNVLESVRLIVARAPIAGMFVFIVLAALSGMLVFFSSAILIPVAVYTWGRAVTVALLLAGWLAGGALSYLIGRYPARRLFQRLLPARKMRKYETAISSKTPFSVVLLFQLALQSEIPGYVLGAARYDFRRYIAALAIVEIPYAIGAIYLSESFIGRNYALMIALGSAAILVAIITFRMFHKRLRQ